MMQRSYSLNSIKPRSLNLSRSPQTRLDFPKVGDSSLYAGVGKKHYYHHFQTDPLPKIGTPPSTRNPIKYRMLEVKDIEGASPSVQPMSLKNKLKAIEYLSKQSAKQSQRIQHDSLQQLQAEFELKKMQNSLPIANIKQRINSQTHQNPQYSPSKVNMINSVKLQKTKQTIQNSNIFSLGNRKFNPTYLSTNL